MLINKDTLIANEKGFKISLNSVVFLYVQEITRKGDMAVQNLGNSP